MKTKIPVGVLENFFNSNFTVKTTPDPNEIRINSIYSDDSKFHTYINLEKNIFNDFKNGGGSIYKLIADFLSISEDQVFYTLVKEYSGRSNTTKEDLIKREEIIKEQIKIKLPEHLYWFSDVKSGFFRDKAYSYLKKRGIKEDYINEMGYCVDGDFDKRIIIPFWENGELVYFVARDYGGASGIKYKNPTGVGNRDFIYNYDKIKDEVIIAEGIMDILSLDEQVGFPIMSAHLSRTQVIKMFEKMPKRIIIVPDTDKTGSETLQRNIDIIYLYKPASVKIEFGVYHIPDGFKDLNELKERTGKNYIDFNECEKRGRKDFNVLRGWETLTKK